MRGKFNEVLQIYLAALVEIGPVTPGVGAVAVGVKPVGREKGHIFQIHFAVLVVVSRMVTPAATLVIVNGGN